MTDLQKMALLVSAGRRMRFRGVGCFPPRSEPEIQRRHIDGPYISFLDGGIQWLTLTERLMTKLGIWTAWDIEARHHPYFEEPAHD